ncbi:MAG: acylphosphatase [Steroidobacteraceae bacterium]|nr:acylphosphatase [Steroidobacteraceae bacterium]
MTSAKVARRAWVVGRVQGVWFRGATRDRALELGLRGYAHNLPDGRVEVLAVGEAHAVERLLEWLWQGPPLARVTEVRVEAVEPVPAVDGFARG